MSAYLGFIDVKKVGMSTFFNFKPIYRFENGQFLYLSQMDRQELLPKSEYTNINFYSNDLDYHISDHFSDGQYVIFDFELSELEDNINYTGERNRTGYKIDVSHISKGKIRELSEVGYYQVIPKEDIHGDYRINTIVPIEGNGLYESQLVLLQDTMLIGPYPVGFRTADSQYYINTRLKENKYIVTAVKSHSNNLETNSHTIGAPGYDRKLFYMTADAYNINVDVISDSILLQNFRESLSDESLKNGLLDINNIDGLLENYYSSLLVGALIPSDIQAKRLDRIRDLLTNEGKLQETFDYVTDTLSALLLKYKDSSRFTEVLEHISTDDKFMNKVQSFRIIQERIAALNNNIEVLKREKDSLDEEIAQKGSEKVATEILAVHQKEIDNKIKEQSELQNKIEELRKRLGLLENCSNLQQKLERLIEDVDYKEKRERELDNKISSIEARLDKKFEDSTEKVVDFAFDGMLANKLLQQAAKWETVEQDSDYLESINRIKLNSVSKKTKSDLITYICEQVTIYRPGYNKNTILNIMICLSQGFLTVFSGEPGTGKTSICNIIAHVLGLSKLNKINKNIDPIIDINRYITVSVERGWTSKRDLIGYYNPLTKTFDKSNRRVFDGFRILHYEANGHNTNLPFVILLDEANLSPMEYYWADFMNICDDRSEKSSINLGENYEFNIPDSLRFVATINNDHTTETLSPRLIDRSWVIILPQMPIATAYELKLDDANVDLVPWSSIVETFCNSSSSIVEMDGEVKELYEKICFMFKQEHLTISTRTDKAIRKYWSVAQGLFERDSYGTDASIIALDYATSQKILPQLCGNGDKYRKFLDSLLAICNDNNLNQSGLVLKSIIEKGDASMKYYQFFN